VSSIGLGLGVAGTGLATLVGLIRSLSGLLAVPHHKLAAGVSQADSAGSIPVTRSNENPHVRDVIAAAGHMIKIHLSSRARCVPDELSGSAGGAVAHAAHQFPQPGTVAAAKWLPVRRRS
jgi:hypothetical protein